MELYKKHRPKSLKQLVGQAEAVSVLSGFIRRKTIPHAILLSGPSGVGKTTIARILSRKLGCSESDYVELDAASTRGIDTIRDIQNRARLSPIGGDARVWVIDECSKLTSDASNSFLKLLEDTPKHTYFILATTEPQKLLKTIKTRCTEIKLKSICDKALSDLVEHVIHNEGMKTTEEVIDKIVSNSDGSARKALVLLNQIMELENEEDQLDAIEKSENERQSFDIARALMDTRTKWADMCEILKEVDDEPESIRWMVLGYANKVLLGGGRGVKRAALMIEYFQDNFFDSKKAGLVKACYDVVTYK